MQPSLLKNNKTQEGQAKDFGCQITGFPAFLDHCLCCLCCALVVQHLPICIGQAHIGHDPNLDLVFRQEFQRLLRGIPALCQFSLRAQKDGLECQPFAL